jgi:hypothetical protein
LAPEVRRFRFEERWTSFFVTTLLEKTIEVVPDASLLSFGQFFEVGFTLGLAATSRHGLFPAGFRARRSEDRRWGRTD